MAAPRRRTLADALANFGRKTGAAVAWGLCDHAANGACALCGKFTDSCAEPWDATAGHAFICPKCAAQPYTRALGTLVRVLINLDALDRAGGA